MPLFDVPVTRGYTVLTHTGKRLFQKNGFNQVGNTAIPTHQITDTTIKKSALYNKNISGIAEAGYGRRYPFRGLSYAGAGSPRSSIYKPGMGYAGAGSPRSSIYKPRMGYAGAGSPRTSIYKPGMGYAGAGSPRTSILRDAYINDNPPPGSLSVLPPAVVLARGTNFAPGISGLGDDPTAVDTGTAEGPTLPGQTITTTPAQPADSSGGFFTSIENAFGSIFGTAVQTGSSAASTAVANAISGAVSPSASPTAVAKPIVSTAAKTILGMSATTVTLLAVGIGAYYVFKK